ncbi:hypothetical protein [Bauldia litoralis]|uniref:hypothetical protein n=1 Tax=Bauldia litoralis TaxID=665467 RepID=UPI0032662921
MAMCSSQTKSSTSGPNWVNKAGKDAYKAVDKFTSKSFKPYKKDRVEGLSGNQRAGIDQIAGYAADGPDAGVYGDVSDIFKTVARTGVNDDAYDMVQDAGSAPADQQGRSLIDQGANAAVDPTGRGMIETGGNSQVDARIREMLMGAANSGVDPQGQGYISGAATAGPQSVATERVVDEGGRLGSIESYINPYIDQVLNPALRQIDEGAAMERKRIGDNATGAGAFGDARQGVLEGELGQRVNTARGDVTGRTYSDAFTTAMGQRTSDLDRFLNTDIINANFGETALDRLMAGGTTLAGLDADAENRRIAGGTALAGIDEAAAGRKVASGQALANLGESAAGRKMAGGEALANLTENEMQRRLQAGESLSGMSEAALSRQAQAGRDQSAAADAEQARKLSRLQSLLTAGTIEQQVGQNQKDAQYEEFLRKQNDPYDKLGLMISGLSGVPYQKTTTSTQPDNSIASLFGAGIGAFV